MKKIIGFFSLFFSLSATILIVLKIWKIDVFSAEDYQKTAYTVLVCLVASVVLIVLFNYFMKDHTKGYNIEKNKVSGKKLN